MRRRASLLLSLAFSMFSTIILCTDQASAVTENVLHSFDAVRQGSAPTGGLVADAAGNLYGTTSAGGVYGFGTIFELIPTTHGGWTESALYSFKGGSDGSGPLGTMVFDGAGNLYGTTFSGGQPGCYQGNGCGLVFKLAPTSSGRWTEKVLYAFNSIDGGEGLTGNLLLDSGGNLYGTASPTTTSSHGIAFELTPTAVGPWKETVLHVFPGEWNSPNGPLIMDKSGNLYGTTTRGGAKGDGAVFKLTRAGNTWMESTLYSFSGGVDGGFPSTGLIFDQAGNLYGATNSGGTGGYGVVFQAVAGSNGQWTVNVVYNFQTDGNAPLNLVFDDIGNLYGSTYLGASDGCGCGTAFELTPNRNGEWTETNLWNFTGGMDGQNPSAVTLSPTGRVYGTSRNGGGPGGNGTVFELSDNGNGQWQENTIFNFRNRDGANPVANLVIDGAGSLYGVTPYGGANGTGTVFKLAPVTGGGWPETILYSFPGIPAGVNPNSLIFDGAGNLFGTTPSGGAKLYQGGTVFELSPSSGSEWTVKYIYSFLPLDGVPVSLVFDKSGNIYGAGQGGGYGEIFELSPDTRGQWTEKVIHRFTGYPNDGMFPNPGLIMDDAGNLYGTTQFGGAGGCTYSFNGCGLVFELSPGTHGVWKETLLYEFSDVGENGASPLAGVILDHNGNLYGTTSYGGDHGCPRGCGTVFELSRSSGGLWNQTVLHRFSAEDDGNHPFAGLVFDQFGDLYGTAVNGGGTGCLGSGCGVVFELSPAPGGWNETVLYRFTGPPGDGEFPEGGVVLDPLGHLYGTTINGGEANQGSVFEIRP